MSETTTAQEDDPRPHVLAIDDSPIIIKALHMVLGEAYEMHFALNGEEGLQLARELEPDLILLDVIMPGMDGYEVCKRLKSDEALSETPVIFLTSLEKDADEARGLEVGAVDYLHKPVRPSITHARVGVHIRLKQQQDELRRLATRDALTGLWNRRELFNRLEREWARGHREHTPLSLILADVDDFKAYNDHYGHLEGDDCLRKVASVLEGSLHRPSDIVGRYGGEEFCCVLPGTDLEGARTLAGAISEGLRAASIPHEDARAADRVTLSMGVVSQIPDQETTVQELLDQADKNLYLAKENGRDRFEG